MMELVTSTSWISKKISRSTQTLADILVLGLAVLLDVLQGANMIVLLSLQVLLVVDCGAKMWNTVPGRVS